MIMVPGSCKAYAPPVKMHHVSFSAVFAIKDEVQRYKRMMANDLTGAFSRLKFADDDDEEEEANTGMSD